MALDTAFIAQVFDAVTSAAGDMAPRLIEAGGQLLFALAVIQLVWSTIIALLDDGGFPAIFANFLLLGLRVSMIGWAIHDLVPLTTSIIEGFDLISSKLTGAADGRHAIESSMAAMMTIANNLWASMGSGGGPDLWDVIRNTFSGNASFFVKVATLVILMLMSAITGAIFVMSQVQAQIAIALAPVFLPFFIIPLFSKYADGLLTFFLKACLMRTLGIVMLALAGSMTAQLDTLTHSLNSGEAGTLDMTASIIVLFVAAVMFFLALQIPAMANGLMSGSVVGGVNLPRPRSSSGGGGGGSKPPVSPTSPAKK